MGLTTAICSKARIPIKEWLHTSKIRMEITPISNNAYTIAPGMSLRDNPVYSLVLTSKAQSAEEAAPETSNKFYQQRVNLTIITSHNSFFQNCGLNLQENE